MISELPPLKRDYTEDPNIKALKRRGFIDHRSALLPGLDYPQRFPLRPS